MTSADKRVLELVDRWLDSLDLHLKYVDLDDAAYWQVQSWPKHDRPTRWILELARQKTLELKSQCEAHAAKQDASFAESLELMQFLANLVGSQNVQRFIPLADPAKKKATGGKSPPLTTKSSDEDDTREMPRPKVAPSQNTASAPPVAPRPKNNAGHAHGKHANISSDVKTKAAQPKQPAAEKVQEVVMADAIRLLKWGRQWHELPELIARMAERPAVTEVRRILRTRRADIDSLATK